MSTILIIVIILLLAFGVYLGVNQQRKNNR